MGKLFTLIAAFCVSLLVGGMIQNVLAVWAKATEEFIAAILLFVLATMLTTIVFGVVLFARVSVDRAALWMSGTVLALAAVALMWSGIAQGTAVFTKADLVVMSYMVVPTLVMIAVQWWMVRRRALRLARENVAG